MVGLEALILGADLGQDVMSIVFRRRGVGGCGASSDRCDRGDRVGRRPSGGTRKVAMMTLATESGGRRRGFRRGGMILLVGFERHGFQTVQPCQPQQRGVSRPTRDLRVD